MARGFIRGDFEVRLLILYILGRVIQGVDIGTLTDLTLCDDGVNYFQFSDAVSSLQETGHIQLSDQGLYTITERGRQNGATCESELPYSVRLKCDRSIAELNRRLMRQNQVRAKVVPRADGEGYTAAFALDDDMGNVMNLELMVPSKAQGDAFSRAFRQNAEQIYNVILTALSAGDAAESDAPSDPKD